MQLLQHFSKSKIYEESEKLTHAFPWYLRPFFSFDVVYFWYKIIQF